MRFSHLVSADLTDTGRVRTNNEDAAVCLPASGLFCVADGMGGAAEGELASRTIIDALEEAFSGRHSDGEPDFERTKELIREAALNANAWIHEHAEDQGSGGMGSTVVMLAFDPDDPRRATVMHAGDSRAYRLRGDTLTRLMKDHSLVSEAGLDDRASLGPMFSSMVTRAVGIRTAFELEEAAADVLENDLFLLCSDGLTTMVPDADLLRCLCENRERDAAEICRMLVDESNQRGGEDNITVVIIKVGSLPEPDALNAVAHKVDAVVEVQPADEEPQVEAPEELGGLEERSTTPFSDSSEEPDEGRNDRSVSTNDLECETPAAVKTEKTTEPIVLPRAKPAHTIPAPPPVREPSASLLWIGAATFGLLVVVVVWLLIVPSGTRRNQTPAVKVIGPGTTVRLSDSDISNVRATLPARMDGTLLTGEWGAMSGYVSKWTPAIPDLLTASDRGALYASWTGLWKQVRDGKVDAMVVCRQYREEVAALCRKAGFALPAVEAEPPATGSAEFRADAACRIIYGLQKHLTDNIRNVVKQCEAEMEAFGPEPSKTIGELWKFTGDRDDAAAVACAVIACRAVSQVERLDKWLNACGDSQIPLSSIKMVPSVIVSRLLQDIRKRRDLVSERIEMIPSSVKTCRKRQVAGLAPALDGIDGLYRKAAGGQRASEASVWQVAGDLKSFRELMDQVSIVVQAAEK